MDRRVTSPIWGTLPPCKQTLSVAWKSINQEKWLKDDKAPEKPIETTAESSFTSLLASGASFLGREAAKRETKSREVSRHIKNSDEVLF